MTTAECHTIANRSEVEGLSRLTGGMLSGNRAAYVDLSRGLLIVMMMVVHATLACTESLRQQIQHLWLLNIATIGFTMLAGYTVGMRYAGVGWRPQASRLFTRALQLLVVMLYSNLLLQMGKLFLNDQLQATVSLSWLIGLFTFDTPYNISGVLLPIALLLPLLPLLYKSERRWGKWVYLAWLMLMVALVFVGTPVDPQTPATRKLHSLLWVTGLGGFPVVPFIGYGVLGFVTARLFARETLRAAATLRASALVGFSIAALNGHHLVASASVAFIQGERILGSYLVAELQFLTILAGGILLAWMLHRKIANSVPDALMTLGRYALFAFVIHRIIGHSLVWTLGLKNGGYEMFVFMFVSILGLTYLACLARMRWATLDHMLARLYL